MAGNNDPHAVLWLTIFRAIMMIANGIATHLLTCYQIDVKKSIERLSG